MDSSYLLKKLYRTLILVTVLAISGNQPVHSHGGGLDSSGCHHNKKLASVIAAAVEIHQNKKVLVS